MPGSSFGELARQQISDFPRILLGTVVTFLALCALTILMAGDRDSNKKREPPPPEFGTDLTYWLLNPAVRVVTRFVIVGVVALVAWFLGKSIGPGLFGGFGPVSRQPRWLMVLELFVLVDLSSYWSHRLCHDVPFLWRFHAVHHSPVKVRWTSTARVHPVNDLVTYSFNVAPFLALGFPINALVPFIPLVAFYAVYLHSKSTASYGPLKGIFASPLFHRWHHTYPSEGGNKNFSGIFAVWDRLFGTYYMPEGRLPERFGIEGEVIAENFLVQMGYPWRRR